MSCKLNSSMRMNSDGGQWGKGGPGTESSVKFAGEEAKDRLYEPKHKKKFVRVLTVIAYVFFVSLAAIMLSLYYIFLWDGSSSDSAKDPARLNHTMHKGDCPHGDKNVLVKVAYEPTPIPVLEATTGSSPSPFSTSRPSINSDEAILEDIRYDTYNFKPVFDSEEEDSTYSETTEELPMSNRTTRRAKRSSNNSALMRKIVKAALSNG